MNIVDMSYCYHIHMLTASESFWHGSCLMNYSD